MVLGSAEIKLILSAVDRASKELDKVNKSLGKIDDTAEQAQTNVNKSGSGMTDSFRTLATAIGVVSGVAIAFGVAIKKALDLGKEGAQIELTAGRFDRLSISIGTTSQALLADLRTATRGTVSDLDLMSAATDFLALGLAKDHGEVVRLTRVAGALGMDMNQLVLTLTNMTTMRFDALGVSVDGFDAKVKKLEQSGLDAATAFRQAFLEQAEQQIRRVGDVADTNAGKIMQFEAAAENLSNTFKKRLAPSVTAVYQELFRLLATAEEELTAMGISEKAIRDTAESYDDYRMALDKALEGTSYMIDESGNLIRIVKTQYGEVRYLEQAEYALTDAQWGNIEVSELLNDQRQKNAEATRQLADITRDAAGAELDLKQAMSDLKQVIAGELGKELDSFNDKVRDLVDKSIELRKKIEELEQKKYLTAEQKNELKELKVKFGEVQEQITANADAHDEATRRILFNILIQRAEIDGLSQAEYEALTLIAEGWGLIDQSTADAMQRADEFFAGMDSDTELTKDDLKEIDRIIRNWPTEHNLTFNTTYRSSGSPPPYAPIPHPGETIPQRRRQHGGEVSAGAPYLVGERGPELFMPQMNGEIVPNWQTKQITNHWNMTINEAGRTVDPARSFMLMQALAGA